MAEPIVTFLYASQMGNSEDISMNLYTTAKEKGYTVERYQFDDHLESFDLTDITTKRVVVIVCSSTGDGDCPDNGSNFYKYLQRHSKTAQEEEGLGNKIFRHLHYTILGLGNSGYSSFQKSPITVNS